MGWPWGAAAAPGNVGKDLDSEERAELRKGDASTAFSACSHVMICLSCLLGASARSKPMHSILTGLLYHPCEGRGVSPSGAPRERLGCEQDPCSDAGALLALFSACGLCLKCAVHRHASQPFFIQGWPNFFGRSPRIVLFSAATWFYLQPIGTRQTSPLFVSVCPLSVACEHRNVHVCLGTALQPYS